MNRDMLSRRLGRRGCEVQTATDGEMALAEASDLNPDLILMDVSLPGIDGHETTRRLRQNPNCRHIPIIALTAHAMERDREAALNAGCDDFDTKPVDFKRLLGKINKLLT